MIVKGKTLLYHFNEHSSIVECPTGGCDNGRLHFSEQTVNNVLTNNPTSPDEMMVWFLAFKDGVNKPWFEPPTISYDLAKQVTATVFNKFEIDTSTGFLSVNWGNLNVKVDTSLSERFRGTPAWTANNSYDVDGTSELDVFAATIASSWDYHVDDIAEEYNVHAERDEYIKTVFGEYVNSLPLSEPVGRLLDVVLYPQKFGLSDDDTQKVRLKYKEVKQDAEQKFPSVFVH